MHPLMDQRKGLEGLWAPGLGLGREAEETLSPGANSRQQVPASPPHLIAQPAPGWHACHPLPAARFMPPGASHLGPHFQQQ